jgi:gliding motility-associated-like protein
MLRYLFLFFIFTNSAFAQPNLVQNGSFEIYKNCPTDAIKLDSTLNAKYWFGFGGFYDAPVYFNSCSNPLPFSWGFGVPLNNGGYQLTKSGNAYAAFHPTTYHYINNIGFKNDYIGNRLKEICINRLLYEGSFYCAASDKFYTNNGAFRNFAVSNMGMLFCNSIPKLKKDNYIELSAQINNDLTNILNDTINWMEVSGMFEADGTEQYLLIGTFNPNADTKFYNTYGHPEPWLNKEVEDAAYYIDDVSLIPQNTTHFYDTLLCSNAPLQLGAVAQADSFEWNDGNKTDKIRSFTSAGLVWVKSWLYGGTVYMWDSLNIIPNNTNSGLPKDTFLCNEQTQLNISTTNTNAGATYLWNNGSTNKSLLVNRVNMVNGKVWLTTTANYCTQTDTVTIYQKPALQIPINDTTTCFEDVPQILLDAGANYKSYLWLPTGETSKTVYSNQAQIYKLTVTDSFNCSASKNIIVDELCKAEIFLPNAFTPNGDGKNETYKPILKTKNLFQYELKIYDSWGSEVFSTNDPNQTWDAKNNLQGVYVVTVNYQYKNFAPSMSKGTVTVLR